MQERVKILVCCHKEDQFKSDDVYMPIHVGKKNSGIDLGIQGDDEGDNISDNNASYCELTGLYWAWKNIGDYDYIGLCHYRRYFDFRKRILNLRKSTNSTSEYFFNTKQFIPDIDKLFRNYDVILPNRNVYPNDLKTQYAINHISDDYYTLKDVVQDISPAYLGAFKYIFEENNRFSQYNMFIMNNKVFNDYCDWLFPILAEINRRIDITNYNAKQIRIFGYMSERLLNVYVRYHSLRVKYYPILYISDKRNKSIFRDVILDALFNISFNIYLALKNIKRK